LDAIHYALSGTRVQPPEVIRRGTEHAQVVLVLDGLVVTRTWTPKGSYLQVESADGAKYPSPAAMLEKLWAAAAADPLGFTRLDRAKQLAAVKELVKLDTTELDQRRQAVVERRTEAKRLVDQLGRQLEAMPKPPSDGPVQRVSVAELLDQQAQMQKQKEANEKERQVSRELAQKAAEWKTKVTRFGDLVANLRHQLELAELDLAGARDQVDFWDAKVKEHQVKLDALVEPDLAGNYQQLKRAEATNELAREEEQRTKLQLDLSKRREEHQVLDAEVARIDEDKAKAIAEAKFPVDGLGFGSDGLTWKGLPFEQASAAEQLRVSVAMAIALNPKLRVMLVRDASLLDSQSLQLLEQTAEAAGFQVWIERVTDAGGVGVVIEDGQVLEQEASTDAA